MMPLILVLMNITIINNVMTLRIIILIIILFSFKFPLLSQNKTSYNIVFYNCENLFDPIDDPRTNDNDFLPNSKRSWTWQKYQKKLENISKVFLATGIEPPIIIGLAEVENYLVLKHLTSQTGLSKFSYKILAPLFMLTGFGLDKSSNI